MSKDEHRKKELDHMVDERFAEIFFLTKEEYHISANSDCERELYDMLDVFKRKIRLYCSKQEKKQQQYLDDFASK